MACFVRVLSLTRADCFPAGGSISHLPFLPTGDGFGSRHSSEYGASLEAPGLLAGSTTPQRSPSIELVQPGSKPSEMMRICKVKLSH